MNDNRADKCHELEMKLAELTTNLRWCAWIAGVAGAVLLVWGGYTSWVQIPQAVNHALDVSALGAAKAQIEGASREALAGRDAILAAVENAKAKAMLWVPLGAMLPFFGSPDGLPKGFVLVSSKHRSPDAPWVPSHLRGQPMPDLTQEVLVGGAGDPSAVGQILRVGTSRHHLGLRRAIVLCSHWTRVNSRAWGLALEAVGASGLNPNRFS